MKIAGGQAVFRGRMYDVQAAINPDINVKIMFVGQKRT
jgi:hypothetical protein